MSAFESTLARFSELRVMVVGDVMLDRFVYGAVNRISPEAPTPVITAAEQKEMLGGAANVALNLVSLGGQCILVGLIGEDEAGTAFRCRLRTHSGVEDLIVVDGGRCTTVKTRFVSPLHNTHLLRADWETTAPATLIKERAIIASVKKSLSRCNAVILSDYGKGTLTPAVTRSVIRIATSAKIPIVVDPKGLDYRRYAGATAVTPNLIELSLAVGTQLPQDDATIEASVRRLLSFADLRCVVVKRSDRGVQVVSADLTRFVLPAVARRVTDVSGAGDSFVAAFTLALAAGATLQGAARIGNAAGALAVEKAGTVAIAHSELREFLIPRSKIHYSRKVFSDWLSLRELVEGWQQANLTVGFTNGCFDLLHPGHIYLLSEARSRVDKLVVALNSDASIKRLKGELRPIQHENARVAVIAGLEAVDAITIFGQDTPYELISLLKPQVLFKGGDYAGQEIVGADTMARTGGRVDIISTVPEESTTSIIGQIKDRVERTIRSNLDAAACLQ